MQLHRPLATITPTLDGDILAVLARTTTTFTITQIHRILGRAAEGIRKALLRLTAQGIVLSDRVGTTTTYILNTEHLAAQPICDLANFAATFWVDSKPTFGLGLNRRCMPRYSTRPLPPR